MKLPGPFGSLLSGKKETITYLSLYIDAQAVAASFWQMDQTGQVKTLASAHAHVAKDSWEERRITIDHILGALEEKTGLDNVKTTILGLAPIYLTAQGEIQKEVRPSIKAMARDLELTLVGFVSLTQAIMYKLKTDEGVPPSVILVGVNGNTLALSLYKVGTLVGVRDMEKQEDIGRELDQAFKSFAESEVLPARILLYGSDVDALAKLKSHLMHYPWTAKANFLHFPKIEVVAFDMIIDAVSLACASEMKQEVGENDEDTDEVAETGTSSQQAEIIQDDEAEHTDSADDMPHEAIADETPVAKEVEEAQEEIDEDFAVADATGDDNVQMVDPSSLGFSREEDVLEEASQLRQQRKKIHVPSLNFSRTVGALFSRIPQFKANQKGLLLFFLCVVGGALVWIIFLWTIPRATVTILATPKMIEKTERIIVDPSATVVDAERLMIPGHLREIDVKGDKSIAVTGKKSVGDPAKGTVTIYNKSLHILNVKKGAVLTHGALKFTIDSDVAIASASESIGSITFGKHDVSVTSSAIGTSNNLPSGSEFSIANVGESTAIARNDAALTGGTSREVVVVTRTDYDALVKAVSEDVKEQAKQQLSSSVDGEQKLIDETISTSVKEKVFEQELEEESSTLSGNVTITVSAIAYAIADVHQLFMSSISSDLPEGYRVEKDSITIDVSNVTVAKDKTITAEMHIKTVAVPEIDTKWVATSISGKTLSEASDAVKKIPGIAGLEVEFHLSPTRRSLPVNTHHITVSVAVAK